MTSLPICETWTTQLDSLLDDVEQGGHSISQILDPYEVHIFVFRINIAGWPDSFGSMYRPEGQARCKHGGQRVIPATYVQERLRLMLEARGFRVHSQHGETLEPLPKENLGKSPSHIAVYKRVQKRRKMRWIDRFHPTRLFDKYPICWAWSDELDRDMDYVIANTIPLMRAKRSGCTKSVNVNNAVMGVDKWPFNYGVVFHSVLNAIPQSPNCYQGRCAHDNVDVMPRYSTRKRLRKLVEYCQKNDPELLNKTEWFEP